LEGHTAPDFNGEAMLTVNGVYETVLFFETRLGLDSCSCGFWNLRLIAICRARRALVKGGVRQVRGVELDPVTTDLLYFEAICNFTHIDGHLLQRPPLSFDTDVSASQPRPSVAGRHTQSMLPSAQKLAFNLFCSCQHNTLAAG